MANRINIHRLAELLDCNVMDLVQAQRGVLESGESWLYCGRGMGGHKGSVWGNYVGQGLGRDAACQTFRDHLRDRVDKNRLAAITELRRLNGRLLVCWCNENARCHCDTLVNAARWAANQVQSQPENTQVAEEPEHPYGYVRERAERVAKSRLASIDFLSDVVREGKDAKGQERDNLRARYKAILRSISAWELRLIDYGIKVEPYKPPRLFFTKFTKGGNRMTSLDRKIADAKAQVEKTRSDAHTQENYYDAKAELNRLIELKKHLTDNAQS